MDGKLRLTVSQDSRSAQQRDAVLEALGHRNRRRILEVLRGGAKPVVEIARALPVSRPAVSLHLRVLKDAGLVVDRVEGTRRFYSVNPKGLETLRGFLESFWTDALARFAEAAATPPDD